MEISPVVYVVENAQSSGEDLGALLGSVSIESECYHSGLDFVDRCSLDRPGCVVMEVLLAGVSGLDVQERLNARRASHPVIFLTSCNDVDVAVRAMKNGAFDFMLKPFSRTLFIERVHQAIAAHREIWARQLKNQVIENRLRSLSSREREVLSLVLTGSPTKQIAAELKLSGKTVENYRSRIMEKMGVNGAVELTYSVLSANAELPPDYRARTDNGSVWPNASRATSSHVREHQRRAHPAASSQACRFAGLANDLC